MPVAAEELAERRDEGRATRNVADLLDGRRGRPPQAFRYGRNLKRGRGQRLEIAFDLAQLGDVPATSSSASAGRAPAIRAS
jgi:hypothetical protein